MHQKGKFGCYGWFNAQCINERGLLKDYNVKLRIFSGDESEITLYKVDSLIHYNPHAGINDLTKVMNSLSYV